ncbi:MAG: hypothetical protein PWR10_70 [Halanaerobiales bacterium]|nr:hypothetical protein [Halanaerobiales bacterium]
MARYARIIVDIPVAGLNQVYDYTVPEGLRERTRIGQVVTVPFGRRRVNGFVVGFAEKPQIEAGRVKDILKINTEEPLFDEEMLKLLKWIAAYYKSYLIKVIKTAIPTGLVSGRVGKKRIGYLKLNQPAEKTRELVKKLKKRAPKQARVLQILLESKRSYSKSKLAEMAGTSSGTVSRLLEKGYLKYVEEVEERRPVLEKDELVTRPFKPTAAQAGVIRAISGSIKEGSHKIFLLHGVTGSGKTEVYLQVIEEVLQAGKGAIVLVPEISLTPLMVRRFYSRFGDEVAVLHSNLSLGERYDEWRRLKRGDARIAIGARSAIFAPVNNLGLIILDEEHENSYKQGENPYYHAREVALKRGKILEIPVVLGSATPSVESFYWAKRGRFHYLELPERINQDKLPPVKIIDMREELKKGNTSFLSHDLERAIEDSLARDEQVLIFLNRRGYANFILCRECGHVIKCQNCDISLTYHAGANHLRCHYCDFTRKVPKNCPQCGSKYIREFGIGTERVEEELSRIFPGAVIDRMDVDTTTRKGSHRKILAKLERGDTDILVGTQMIAKGHDYPNISVVGVITADTILNIPDFRSAERTFQLLTQVAGRTGRGDKAGKVIIQTYTPGHYSILAASRHDYTGFFQQEIKLREKLFYPPFAWLTNIVVQGYEESSVMVGAQKLGKFLQQYHKYIDEILGPSPAPINKLRKRFRWQLILKFRDWNLRNFVLTELEKRFLIEQQGDVVFNIDVDPLKML